MSLSQLNDAETNSETGIWRRLAAFFTVAFWREWWSRPCGGRETLALAVPIVISSGSIALMNFADRVYLTWYDPRAMSAAFQAGCLLWALLTFPTGIAAFTNTFVSQYFGAKQRSRIGSVVWQGFFFSAVTGAFFVLGTPLVGRFFSALGHAPDLIGLERDYWFYFSLGSIASIGHEPFAAYFLGRREMKTVMTIGIAAVLLNVVLDPILIFGVCGHARMGVAGAALASAISLWVKFFLYVFLAFKRDAKERCGLRDGLRLDLREMKRLLKYGAMSSVQVTIENSFFMIFVLLTGWFGEMESAATAIAFNLNFLVFMPIFGVGVAIQTLVGNQVGAERPDLAVRAVRTASLMAICFSGCFAIAFFFAPNFFLDLYAMRSSESFETIRPMTVNITRFVALYLFADSLNTIFTASLRGAGDARFIMIATSIVVVPIISAIFIGALCFGRGIYWSWSFMTAYLFINATTFIIRFARGGWRDKSLVQRNAEPNLVAEEGV